MRLRLTLAVVVALLAGLLGIGHVNAVTSWQLTSAYPLAVNQHSCVVDTNSAFVYCIGGQTGTGNTQEVDSAPISAMGEVGPWSTTHHYPLAIDDQSCVVDSGFV